MTKTPMDTLIKALKKLSNDLWDQNVDGYEICDEAVDMLMKQYREIQSLKKRKRDEPKIDWNDRGLL